MEQQQAQSVKQSDTISVQWNLSAFFKLTEVIKAVLSKIFFEDKSLALKEPQHVVKSKPWHKT